MLVRRRFVVGIGRVFIDTHDGTMIGEQTLALERGEDPVLDVELGATGAGPELLANLGSQPFKFDVFGYFSRGRSEPADSKLVIELVTS